MNWCRCGHAGAAITLGGLKEQLDVMANGCSCMLLSCSWCSGEVVSLCLEVLFFVCTIVYIFAKLGELAYDPV